MGLLNFIDYYQIKLKKTYKTNSQNTQKINTETTILPSTEQIKVNNNKEDITKDLGI